MSHFPSIHLDAPILDVDIKRAERLYMSAYLDEATPWDKKHWGSYMPEGCSPQELTALTQIANVFTKARSALNVDMGKVSFLDPSMYPYLMNVPTAPADKIDRVIAHAEAAIRPLIAAQIQALAQMTDSPIENPPTTMFNASAKHFYAVEEVYAALIEEFVGKQNTGAPRALSVKRDFCQGIISDPICVISVEAPFDRWYVCSYRQLMMLRDAAMMRKNGFLASTVLYPEDTVLEESLKKSFNWQEICIERFGNEGYELAKSCESLAKAYLPRVGHDILAGPGDSFDAMLLKVADKERSLRGLTAEQFPLQATLAYHYYVLVLLPLTRTSQVSEVFGLQKFSGHPLIDPRVASAKSRLVAQEPDSTNPDTALHMRAVFSDMFTRSYIAKHKMWPPMEFVKEGTELQRLYEGRVLSLSRQNYDIRDWDFANFLQCLDFDEYENYFEIIEDKSISLLLKEKHASWDGTSTSTHRRLILELLSRFGVDTHEIIKAIEEDRIPLDWLICSLFPKEREFKLAARAFTMMVFEMRAFFTIHEANLGETMLKYFPSITMTDSKLDVHRRFLSMTRPLDSPDLIKLKQELDLTSWNLMWRGIIVEGIGEQINGLYGIHRVYTTVHKFFERCCMMMRVAGCRPDDVEKLWPPASDLIHYFHAGGLEGIAQKLWSICTVAMIQMALHDMKISYTITDQGDNIVLVVTAPRDWTLPLKEQIMTLSDTLLKACSEAATKVHQKLKPEECLVSTIVLTYSKVVYSDGVDYPTSIKALARVYPASAVDFPSISSYIASIFSSCYTAAETAKTPERCWRLAVLHGALFLTRAVQQSGPYTRAVKNRPHLFSLEGIRYQLLWPSELGGYPVIGPYSFFYKGGGDPLSKSVASLKMLQKYLPEARTIIGAMQSDALYDASPKLMSLVQDPYGLPIRKATTPGDAVAKDTLDTMRSLTYNREIREVLEFATDEYEEKLVEAIGTMVPFNPLIAHKLLEASAVGTVNNLKKMGLKTQTIQSIARNDDETNLIGKMIQAGDDEIDSLWRLIVQFNREKGLIISVYDEVERARRRWQICGKTPMGITSYLPIDFQLLWDIEPTGPGLQAEYCTHGQNAFYTRGPVNPFLGSATVSKISDHGYQITGRGYSCSALRALQVVLAWCTPSEETYALIDYLSRMRSGVNLSEYAESLVGVYGGNANHRFDAYLGSRSACLMGQSAFAHYVTLHTDKAGYLSGSTQDYAIMWQEFMCFMTALCSYKWSRVPTKEHGRLILVIGDTQLEPLPDERLEFKNYKLPPAFPVINRLIQSDSIYIRQTGGPIWNSAIQLQTDPAEPYEFAALVCVLSKAVGGRRGLQGVVDNVSLRISVAIGVAELKGMGIHKFLEAAACTLLDTVQGIVHSPIQSKRFNANINFLIQKYGALLLQVIIPYISHPDLADDPVIRKLNLGPCPKYDTRFSADRLLLAELSTTTLRMYQDRKSIYYSYRIAVFGSESLDGTEHAIIRLIRRKSSQAVVMGLISFEEGQFIIGSPLRRLTALQIRDQAQRIEELKNIMYTYDTYRRGIHAVTRPAVNILLDIASAVDGSQIFATRASAEELVRRFRYKNYAKNIRTIPLPPIPNPDLHAILLPLDCQSPPNHLTKRQILLEKLDNAYGQARSFGSGAINAWLPLASRFKNQCVVVVGSGLGACAASALIGGAKEVIGHDLREHYPPWTPLSEYTPPLVRLYGGRRRYRQSEETLATSGDWFDPKVSRLLCEQSNSDYVIVLDVSTEKGFSHEVIRPLVLNEFSGIVYLRSVSEKREQELIAGTISRVGYLISTWAVQRLGSRLEYIYAFVLRHNRWPIMIRPCSTGVVPLLPSVKGRLTIDQLTAYVLAPLGGLTGTTIHMSLVAGIETFVQMITDISARPTYAEWTTTLHSVIACELLLTLDRLEYREVISRLDIGTIYSLLCAPSISVLVTDQLLFFLVQTASRLGGHLNRPVSHTVTIR